MVRGSRTNIERREKHELSNMRNESKLMTFVMILFLLLHLIDPTMRSMGMGGWIPSPENNPSHIYV